MSEEMIMLRMIIRRRKKKELNVTGVENRDITLTNVISMASAITVERWVTRPLHAEARMEDQGQQH